MTITVYHEVLLYRGDHEEDQLYKVSTILKWFTYVNPSKEIAFMSEGSISHEHKHRLVSCQRSTRQVR